MVDQSQPSAYIQGMNLGTRLFTMFNGLRIGADAEATSITKSGGPARDARPRRWVAYNGPVEPTAVPPEWHAWLHYTTEAPIPEAVRRPWQKPHDMNLTGTPASYRPPGHDYRGGHRARCDRRLRGMDAGQLSGPAMARRNIAEILTGRRCAARRPGHSSAYAIAHSGRSVAAAYPLHATFDNIAGLSVGSDVRIGGVKVGSVTDERINPENYLAEVTLTVTTRSSCRRISAPRSRAMACSADKYLALSPSVAILAMLPPGGTITITQSSISIEQLLGKFIFSASNLGRRRPRGREGAGRPIRATGSPK